MHRDAVLAARLATQRLSGPPASGPVPVVRELLCVQAQDAPLARAMIALRCAGTAADVAAAVARGEVVRTHVLRPTWHYVAAEDLRWLLALTSPKVESGMGSRHRQLDLDPARVDAGLDVLAERLAGRRFATRADLSEALAATGVLDRDDGRFGEQIGHLLLLGELRCVVCSAPVASSEHHYALADDVLPPTAPRDREESVTELVGRFVSGHGPVAPADLVRWAKVTLTEVRAALVRLGDRVAPAAVDGEELWLAPASVLPEVRPRSAWLLSVFDEAFLTYRRVPWPPTPGNTLHGDPRRFAQAAGGVVLHGLRDVGGWRRTRSRGGARIELALDPGLPASARADIDLAVDQLLAAL